MSPAVTTLGEARERYAPLSRVSQAGVVSVYEDCDGDHWLAKHQFLGDHGDDDSQAILLRGDTLPNALDAIDNAGLLPEEYTPGGDSVEDLFEDPSPSPEDVADTWYRAEDNRENVAFIPTVEETEAELDDRCPYGPMAINGQPIQYRPGSGGDWQHDPMPFGAQSIETVDAADVPFSEVPTDE